MAAAPPPVTLASARALAIGQLELLAKAIYNLLALLIFPYASSDPLADLNSYVSQIIGLTISIAQNVAVVAVDEFDATHNLFYTMLTTVLGPFGTSIAGDYVTLLTDVFSAYAANLIANKTVDPTQVDTIAIAALTEASALGLGSRVITALFELFLPKNLNFMNWLGPTLAQFSGFDQIVALVRTPELQAAIGNLARYQANSTFLTVAPGAAEARALLARRLIAQADATKLEGWGGTMVAYQAAQEEAAYRPIPPFLLRAAAEAGIIPAAQLTSALQFAGFRDADITTLENAYAELALAPYQQKYLADAIYATELGVMTPAELTDAMNDINLNQDQQALVQLTVATRKLVQLAELYRKSISEGYKYGLVTDAQYVPSLEAIGIGAADAQAHYAVDSIAKTGKAAAAALKAEERLAAQRMRAGINAAVASFRAGTSNAVGLGAALLAAGADPVVAGLIVELQEARQTGPMVYVYGVELTRDAGLVLRERVSALGVQVRAGLVSPADALTALAGYGVPQENAKALVADWSATKTPAADVGVLEPR